MGLLIYLVGIKNWKLYNFYTGYLIRPDIGCIILKIKVYICVMIHVAAVFHVHPSIYTGPLKQDKEKQLTTI
jgi:hypothetical protein